MTIAYKTGQVVKVVNVIESMLLVL